MSDTLKKVITKGKSLLSVQEGKIRRSEKMQMPTVSKRRFGLPRAIALPKLQNLEPSPMKALDANDPKPKGLPKIPGIPKIKKLKVLK